jgi:hypothetical protein
LLTDLLSGTICDSNGQALPKDTAPLPDMHSPQDWSPFNNKVNFELANFLYCKVQMSAGDIDTITHLWSASHTDCKCPPPFQDHQEMYDKIDAIAVGDAVPWESFTLKYEGPDQDSPTVLPWMKTEYRVYYHDPRLIVKNMLLNPDFKNAIDYAPYLETDASKHRVYHNFMSGDWAWDKAVRLSYLSSRNAHSLQRTNCEQRLRCPVQC